jgi:hypothetical protein
VYDVGLLAASHWDLMVGNPTGALPSPWTEEHTEFASTHSRIDNTGHRFVRNLSSCSAGRVPTSDWNCWRPLRVFKGSNPSLILGKLGQASQKQGARSQDLGSGAISPSQSEEATAQVMALRWKHIAEHAGLGGHRVTSGNLRSSPHLSLLLSHRRRIGFRRTLLGILMALEGLLWLSASGAS